MTLSGHVSEEPQPAPIPAEAKRTLSGLEQMRAIRDGQLGVAPMHALMNMKLVEAEPGRVSFTGVPQEQHYNPAGTVHAAFSAALLDSAMGCAVTTLLPAGVDSTTVEFKLNLVRPVTAVTGQVKAQAWVVHQGRTLATAEGRLSDAAGKLLAHATTTVMILGTAPRP